MSSCQTWDHGWHREPLLVAKSRIIYGSKTICRNRLVNHLHDGRFLWDLYRKRLSLQNICKSFAFPGARKSNSASCDEVKEGEWSWKFYSSSTVTGPPDQGCIASSSNYIASNLSAGGSPSSIGDWPKLSEQIRAPHVRANYAVAAAGFVAPPETSRPTPEYTGSDGQNKATISRQYIGACHIVICACLWEACRAVPPTQAHAWLTTKYPLGINWRKTIIFVSGLTYTRSLRGLEHHTHLDYRHNWRGRRWSRVCLMDSEPQLGLSHPLKGVEIFILYIHGSVDRERNLIIVQQDATYFVYYISVCSSKCFGCWQSSSRARTTVITASGTGQM